MKIFKLSEYPTKNFIYNLKFGTQLTMGNMKIEKGLVTLVIFWISFYAQSQDLTNNTFGKGLINVVAKDSSYSGSFAFRFQSLFQSQLFDPENTNLMAAESEFLIRRARLKFDGFIYSPKLEYKFELGLSNRDISGASEFTGGAPRFILDAFIKWNFYRNFVLWAGQAKLPGNRERVISSANLETVDRSLVNSRFNIDRDVGVQLRHKFRLGNDFIIKEIIAFSQGEGRNITTGNLGGYQYTARAEILPFGEFEDYKGADLKRLSTPKVSVGVSYDYNDDAVKTRSNMGKYMQTTEGFFQADIRTFFVDAMFKYKGFSFMGEYANRTSDKAFAANTDGSLTGDIVNNGSGLNLQGGYLFKNNYQIVGRFTSIKPDFDTFHTEKKQYTLGLSKYVVGHKLKVQTDLSFNNFNVEDQDGLMYRLQLEVHL